LLLAVLATAFVPQKNSPLSGEVPNYRRWFNTALISSWQAIVSHACETASGFDPSFQGQVNDSRRSAFGPTPNDDLHR
jgi:hypothetical protein